MGTLTKTDLVDKVYISSSLSKAQSVEAVELFLALAKASLVNGESLLLSGFGKFSVRDKRERRGRNPQTGSSLMLEARRVVTFKPSGLLRDRVNKP